MKKGSRASACFWISPRHFCILHFQFSIYLDNDRVALRAAAADRGEAETAATTTQFVGQGGDEARATRTDRVAEGDRAAIDIDSVEVGVAEAEAARGDDRDVGEGFVDLEEVDVLDRQSRLIE